MKSQVQMSKSQSVNLKRRQQNQDLKQQINSQFSRINSRRKISIKAVNPWRFTRLRCGQCLVLLTSQEFSRYQVVLLQQLQLKLGNRQISSKEREILRIQKMSKVWDILKCPLSIIILTIDHTFPISLALNLKASQLHMKEMIKKESRSSLFLPRLQPRGQITLHFSDGSNNLLLSALIPMSKIKKGLIRKCLLKGHQGMIALCKQQIRISLQHLQLKRRNWQVEQHSRQMEKHL